MEVYMIAFTGGPCAGKTTVIEEITKKLENDNYYVIVVPETGAELISRGIKPNNNRNHTLRFQELVLETQTRKEMIAEEYAELIRNENLEFIKDKKGIVILYDRAIPDNRAYLSHSEYNDMLKKYHCNELAIIDKYDLVINLVSLATTNPELYCLDGIRYETPKESAYKDMLTSASWCLHRDIKMIKPTEKIEDKISIVYNIISNKLNKKYNNELLEYELDKDKTSFYYLNDDNSRKMKLQTYHLQTLYNTYLTLEKREYNNNVSYILKQERFTNDGILCDSKPISKKQFDYIIRNNFLSEIREKEIINFIDNGNFFSIVKEDGNYKLYTKEENILQLPKNIEIKKHKNFTKKNNMVI